MTSPAPTPIPTQDRPRFAVISLGLMVVYFLGIGAITITALALRTDKAASAEASSVVKISLSEFKIGGTLSVPAGDVILDVTNAGSVEHNLTVGDGKVATKLLKGGGEEKLPLGKLAEGTTMQLFCSVPGHKESGMSATLTVTAAAAAGSSSGSADMAGMDMSGGGGSDGATPDYAKMDADMLATFNAFPAKTEGVGNPVLEPTVLPDGTKQFELTAEIAKWEVEPGRIVGAWTYNGVVPGPMLKLDIGDKVRVIFHNKLPLNQDIHWHGIEAPFAMDGVAPITQEPVVPGGDFVYEFPVDRAYQGMYHPHLHGVSAVPNGMFGVIQVGPTPIPRGATINGVTIPKDVQPAVDIPMVLNDAGAIGFSLNGKSFPATAPIVVNEGEWVAITYYNEGLQSHPMHLHALPQLVTAVDGFPLEQPYFVDTLLVAPGQRFTVLMHADSKGTWVFHCHILSHVESDAGMFGMVTAIVVK